MLGSEEAPPTVEPCPHITFYQVHKSEPFERVITRDGRRYKQVVITSSRRYLAKPLNGEVIKHEADGRYWFEKFSEDVKEQIVSETEHLSHLAKRHRVNHSDGTSSCSGSRTGSILDSRESTALESPESSEEEDLQNDCEWKPDNASLSSRPHPQVRALKVHTH